MTWHLFSSAPFCREARLALGSLAAAGLGAALLTSACTITTSTDDNGSGGTGTGGSSSGGASSGGGSGVGTGGSGTGGDDPGTGGSDPGTGGGGQVAEFDCHEGGVVSGVTASTEPDPSDDACWSCIKTKCADEFADCHAVAPYSVCGWEGAEVLGGEIDCLFECFDSLHDDEIFVGSQDDIDDCLDVCSGAAVCGGTEPSSVTLALASCAIGLSTGDEGCQGIDEEDPACGWWYPNP